MSHVTEILNAVAEGKLEAAEELLPLVYDELRKLAAQKMSHERPGQTLDATGLVHEAYLRLVGNEAPQRWNGRRHFFAAGAEAMRRILVERARHVQRQKHGGELNRVEFDDELIVSNHDDEELLSVDQALGSFAEHDPTSAELVKLHFFGGFTIEEAAQFLGISTRTAYRNWTYAKAWLFRKLSTEDGLQKN